MTVSASTNRPTVVLIGGYGRSGSTLLERMLGQIPGYLAAGELCHIWERGLIENQLCGCGVPLPECALWQDVLAGSFGADWQSAGARGARLQSDVADSRDLHRLLWPGLGNGAFRVGLAEYRNLLESLYLGLHRASGGKLIIDSSKSPSHALAVAGIGKIDLRIAHLVRDSRAVAYSWGRKRVRPEVYWKTMYMPRFSAFRSSAVWLLKNWAISRLGRDESVGYALVRYEDLVARPQETLSKLLDDLGLEHGSTPMEFLSGHRVTLGTNHTAAGNPMRFKTGDIDLRLDDAWLRGMSKFSRAFVSLLTWPGLRRYGYVNAK